MGIKTRPSSISIQTSEGTPDYLPLICWIKSVRSPFRTFCSNPFQTEICIQCRHIDRHKTWDKFDFLRLSSIIALVLFKYMLLTMPDFSDSNILLKKCSVIILLDIVLYSIMAINLLKIANTTPNVVSDALCVHPCRVCGIQGNVWTSF